MTQIDGGGCGKQALLIGMIDLLFGETDLETMWQGLEDDIDHDGESPDVEPLS